MPRENRKRGKKNKKTEKEDRQPEVGLLSEASGEPSWIVPSLKLHEDVNPEAPFGYVDADVKAYFRTVDIQIRNWEDDQEDVGLDDDIDPNEQRRLFFIAALTEMRDKEKHLATDPDCSVILERMSYSMDDFVRRVFVDSLGGFFETLVKHRFASHVCQTLFSVAKDSISRETKGIFPTIPEAPDAGELRTFTQLILDICEELLPTFSALILDPFASHVVRSLLLLLSPSVSTSEDSSQSALRSKRSAAWKAKQGPMKSIFDDAKGKGKEVQTRSVPSSFPTMARRFVETLRNQLSENEVRALAASKVASPGLQMLLQVEADQGMADEPGSLMDKVMVGIISACHENTTVVIEASDYLGTLLRDQTSSHLLEIIVLRCPDNAFKILWSTYFKGKLARLSAHPVANFVLAKALERVSLDQLSEACTELNGTWGKLIRTSRTGVLRAIVDRAAALQALGQHIVQAVYSAFDLGSQEDHLLVAPCILTLLPLQEYKAILASRDSQKNQPPTRRGHHQSVPPDPLEPKVQGAVLLQSILRLPEPHGQFVIDSLNSLSMDERIRIAHSASGSRVYDVLLDSSVVPAKAKRQFVMNFIGYYHLLVDDRIGSRVGDRCWAFADTYLKEKIARSMIPQEQALVASYYGKYFAKNLSLYVLQRRPEEWRNMQSDKKRLQEQKPILLQDPVIEKTTQIPTKRKRNVRPDDEIDDLFNVTLGKKTKKAALTSEGVASEVKALKDNEVSTVDVDKGLQDVLGAIRTAPKDDAPHGKKRRKH